jgi:hypothetical protein
MTFLIYGTKELSQYHAIKTKIYCVSLCHDDQPTFGAHLATYSAGGYQRFFPHGKMARARSCPLITS